MDMLEESYIALYDCVMNGYNCLHSARGRGRVGEETKAKQSAAAKKRGISPETFKKMGKSRAGNNYGYVGTNHHGFGKKRSNKAISAVLEMNQENKRAVIRDDGLIFDCSLSAANYIKRHRSTVIGHLHGKQKTCGSFTFRYATPEELELAIQNNTIIRAGESS